MVNYRFRICFDMDAEDEDDAYNKLNEISDELWDSTTMSGFSQDCWEEQKIDA